MVPDVPTAANIPAVACVPGNVVAHNVPVASAVAFDSAVGVVTWAPPVVMGSAVSGLPAVYVPGVLAVARIYAVAAVLIAFYMPSATGISNVSDVPAVP